ncbi:MAG: sulfatase-like hydrolase/transferase, partial [Actinomycetota bacterium]
MKSEQSFGSSPDVGSDPQVANVVVVILDSLSRNLLGAYQGQFDSWSESGWDIETPFLDRFAQQSVVFDRHHSGSLPCMPARHDLLVGALDFPWRPWGSIEIWEDAITHLLRAQGVTSMLVSDHPHVLPSGEVDVIILPSGLEEVR